MRITFLNNNDFDLMVYYMIFFIFLFCVPLKKIKSRSFYFFKSNKLIIL